MSDDRDARRARWEAGARGWEKRADDVQRQGMPVSAWMLEHAALQPGYRVLELAAGPGDTGFLAAELIEPGGVVVCSDASAAMLEVARARARSQGVSNVEFRRLELEWIDLETASVDAALCRWGYMLVEDPEAAFRETRRVLRPGGRVALAVWDRADANPWATIVTEALVALGLAEPDSPAAPGRFKLADAYRLEELLGDAGFTDVAISALDLPRLHNDLASFLAYSRDLSPLLGDALSRMDADVRREFEQAVASLAAPYTREDGTLQLPARSLVAAASA